MMVYFIISLFFPLLSFVIAGIFSHSKKIAFIGHFCSFLTIVSTISSLVLFNIVFSEGPFAVHLVNFMTAGLFNVDFNFIVDNVSATMMVVVGIVASIVHVYSIGYMEHDNGFNRFFSYLGLFVFSMLFLVLSDNFLGLFIGWEGVGLCSWLLIGFWYNNNDYTWCANEAFIVNRIADLGMLLGIFLIYTQVGSLSYSDVFSAATGVDHKLLIWVGIFLFIGAMGKSAQFPFHTWLADAMAGPTPVSALIHAATMVTAGVYLVIRANAIFSLLPEVSIVIASLGAFVAVFAASMALVNKDLKKIIAYSTLSQLGYMFVATGLGAYWIALFHLMTHAFFKSLLFLCAGNVMHAMKDDLNIKRMGGLFKYMKFTAIFMCIGSLALCGIYPFAGFFSKDKILSVAFSGDHYIIWAVLFIGAIMTTIYSFRVIMLVFFGKARYEHHPHEARYFMLIWLIPLGILAIIAGFFEESFRNYVTKIIPEFGFESAHKTEYLLIAITLIVIIVTAILTILYYLKVSKNLKEPNNIIYKILSNQYFIPQFYNKVFVDGYSGVSKICAKIDDAIIDKIVDGVAKLFMKISKLANLMQNGNLSLMLKVMVVGFFIILLIVIFA